MGINGGYHWLPVLQRKYVTNINWFEWKQVQLLLQKTSWSRWHTNTKSKFYPSNFLRGFQTDKISGQSAQFTGNVKKLLTEA